MVPEVLNDLLGVEAFAAEVGGAGILTAATSGAGVQIQKLLPGELFNLTDAKQLGSLKIDRGYRSPRLKVSKENVYRF